MAGVGFELRKLLAREDYLGQARAYGSAAVLAAGPWLLSTCGLLAVGHLGLERVASKGLIVEFLVSVTYLMASSMILVGLLQFLFTRFIADRIYESRCERLLPNFFGALLLVTLASGALGSLAALLFFRESFLYRLLLLSAFVTLSDIWLAAVFLSGLRDYRWTLLAFLAGYGAAVLASWGLVDYGLEGLMTGFLAGHALLFFLLLAAVIRSQPRAEGQDLVRFEFLSRRHAFHGLALTGLVYHLGMWVDRLVFWLHPATSQAVIGPLRFSVLYDYPLFLASLSIIPGMAVFLLRVETDFAERCAAFFRAILGGAPLERLEELRGKMVAAARQGMVEILQVQAVVALTLHFLGPRVLTALSASPHHVHLFQVATLGFGPFLIFLAALNLLFYLDRRRAAFAICALYLVLDAGLSYLTLRLGPDWFGYGFVAAATITAGAGLALLSRKLERLEYETFMLR